LTNLDLGDELGSIPWTDLLDPPVDVDEFPALIIAGTGSKELQSLPQHNRIAVRNRLRDKLTDYDDEEFEEYKLVIMSGMAEGFDKALALTAIELGMDLICVIPNKGYGEYYWGKHSLTGENQMVVFESILAVAKEVVYVMEDVHHRTGIYLNGVHSNFLRNDYMVQRADRFLVWDPTTPGTKHCFAGIQKAHKPYEVMYDSTTLK
jgi:hypothetical protein